MTEAPESAMLSDLMSQRAEETLALQKRGAALLLSIAGDAPECIEMSRTGAKKYYRVARALTAEDALAHLQGRKTYGASCGYGDGTTRALCYDADTQDTWRQLESAARKLAGAGYKPLLEQSPAGRGGHLWIVFDGLVDATAARSHARGIAPELAAITEYWPVSTRKGNRVRLPGGKYARGELNAWCKLVSVATGETARNGAEAAALLLSHQTPAQIAPVREPEEGNQKSATESREPKATTVRPQKPASLPHAPHAASVDEHWQQLYGRQRNAFLTIISHRRVIDRLNERRLDEIRPRERNGMAFSPNGMEQNASMGYHETPDGERYTDFSRHGLRPDGTHDSGDPLELMQRVTRLSKSQIMREEAKKIAAEDRAAIERAARAGEPLPAWLEEIITDAGHALYEALCRKASQGNDAVSGAMAPEAGAPSEKVQALMEAHHLTHGPACKDCACELYRDLMGSPACVRCFPSKGYSAYAAQVDVLYPRKRGLSLGRER